MAEKNGKSKVVAQVVAMKVSKICKSCVRFENKEEAGQNVAASLYVQNKAYTALGEPDAIKVTIENV
jgi:hypothetical protein